jgi:hypothetical protein
VGRGLVGSAEDVELFVGRFREPARARAGSALYRRFIQPEAARILSGSYRSTRLTTPTLLCLIFIAPRMLAPGQSLMITIRASRKVEKRLGMRS